MVSSTVQNVPLAVVCMKGRLGLVTVLDRSTDVTTNVTLPSTAFWPSRTGAAGWGDGDGGTGSGDGICCGAGGFIGCGIGWFAGAGIGTVGAATGRGAWSVERACMVAVTA